MGDRLDLFWFSDEAIMIEGTVDGKPVMVWVSLALAEALRNNLDEIEARREKNRQRLLEAALHLSTAVKLPMPNPIQRKG